MRRAAVALTLAFAAGTLGYLAWAYPRLPQTVPMKWDLHNTPVAFGSREAFVGIPAAITLLFAVLFTGVAWWQPKAAGLGPVALGGMLFIVHVVVQAVLKAFLPVPVNVGVLVLFAGVVGTSLWFAFAARRMGRTA
jgi:hypothetical protein